MDPQSLPLYASANRHLPSYDEVNIPYSLRLPVYRSSYMRRFHPYPRYYTPPEQDFTDTYGDELLDLSILEAYVPPPIIQPAAPDVEQGVDNFHEPENAAPEENGENEECVAIVDPGVVYANVERRDLDGNRTGPFLRVDVDNAS